MDGSETTASTSSGAPMVVVMTFVTLLLCLPLIWYVIRIWRPLRVNSSATGLSRGWDLTHVTGEVLDSQRHSQTIVTDDYGPYQTGSRSVRTIIYDNLSLRLADGRNTNVQVVNFNVSAFRGQVVSFWTAHKGSGAFTFAVLNHTTRQQNVNDQQVFRIMLSQVLQIVFVIYLCGLAIPVAVLSVFGGGCVPFLLWLVLLILFVIGQRRVRRKFEAKGMAHIWRVSQAEAQQMMPQ